MNFNYKGKWARAFPFYMQPDSMDCGPTCLRMIAKYYGKIIPLQKLREAAELGKEGVNLLGISAAAEVTGFRSHCLKLTYEVLVNDATHPVILHWNQNHFVVLFKVRKNGLLIADPARGIIKCTQEEFKSHWICDSVEGKPVGIALLLEPAPKFYEQRENEQDRVGRTHGIRNIFYYFSPFKKLVFQLLAGLAAASVLQLALPFLTQSVVDTGINTSNLHFIYIILFAQLALFAGRLVIEFVRGWILLHISTRINVSILNDFLIKLMKLPASFFTSRHTGDILQRMNDHNRIEVFLTGSSLTILFSLINLVIFCTVLAYFNTSIFLVFITASILYSLWVSVFLKRKRALDYKKFDVASREQSLTIQLVQGMQEIKLNGVEGPMRWKWERLQALLFKVNVKGLSLTQWQQAGSFFLNEGKNILITFLSAKAVIDGQMTLGSMLAIQYIIGQLNSPIEQLAAFAQSLQNAKISMERLNEIHKLEDEEPSEKHLYKELPASFTRALTGGRSFIHQPLTGNSGGNAVDDVMPHTPSFSGGLVNDESNITFQNISFTYPGAGNEPVLKDINLKIPRARTTAIVGVSGSGKTTLLKLLLKFYEPQKGEIKLGHMSLGNLSHKAWRQHCGVVMQESFIFSDTIAKNIALGSERIDMEKLQYAAGIANVRDFIETLPLGYNTKLGPDGAGFSQGQKQRILIARAVYRNPEFIFFDEATNSLDANNESIIHHNLESFFLGRTVVVVAHRLSTVKNADQIVVLNKGVITERGTHQELVSLKGEYFTLVKNQLELGN